MTNLPHPATDDSDLLTRLRRRDKAAFEIMYRKYWKGLYDFACTKTRDNDASEEIIQDLFVTIWEKSETLEIKNLPGYLFTALRNRIIDHYKQFVFAGLDGIDPPAFDDYPHFLNELEKEIQIGVTQLPEKTRQVFQLRLTEGKSARQISKLLNFPERTVEYHITQGIKLLKVHLKEYLTFILAAISDSMF